MAITQPKLTQPTFRDFEACVQARSRACLTVLCYTLCANISSSRRSFQNSLFHLKSYIEIYLRGLAVTPTKISVQRFSETRTLEKAILRVFHWSQEMKGRFCLYRASENFPQFNSCDPTFQKPFGRSLSHCCVELRITPVLSFQT